MKAFPESGFLFSSQEIKQEVQTVLSGAQILQVFFAGTFVIVKPGSTPPGETTVFTLLGHWVLPPAPGLAVKRRGEIRSIAKPVARAGGKSIVVLGSALWKQTRR